MTRQVFAMMRLVILGMVLALGASGAAAAESAAERAARCTAQATLVEALVAQRTDGVDMQDAIGAVRAAHEDMDDRLADTMPLLADWVYSVPPEQLGAGVAESFEVACTAYEG
ncbi:hypothetical protein [Sediminimonas sp.]|uniref:hypothetical protein n=1 Tax=Sediminimonas sp. TaxID=2823379 RepID=UPI0025D81B3F|nr:hypothetical protein [Sediminimonas sp.]